MTDTRYITHDKWTSLTATQVTYPNGRQVASGYDALYRCNSITETSGGGSIAAWEFFGSRTAKAALGNGITCSFMNNAQTNSAVQAGVPNPAWGNNTTDRLGYDGSGRLIAKRFLPSGSTTSLVGFTTAYDPSSNKLFERALHTEATTPPPSSRSALYPQYDSMDRLLQYQRGLLASGGGSITAPIALPGTDTVRDYNLDSLGNWKSTVYTPEGGTSTTEIRQHNRLNEITRFGTTPVTYDHGNNTGNPNPLIAQRGNGNIVNDGTRIYAYDALNRLTTVNSTASGTPAVAAYTYDAFGRRVLKVVTNGGISGSIANATYRYLYDGQQIVEELLFASGSYSTLRQFVWGQYIDELIQLKVPATTSTPPLTVGTYYPLQDLLYRATATTNSSAAIVEAYDFDAYGNTLMFKAAGTGGNWWADNAVTTLQPMCENLFTGRQYDPETEVYWYRARYYQPELGRFVGRDPYLEQSTSLYEFCQSNSLVNLDPFGLHCWSVDRTAYLNFDSGDWGTFFIGPVPIVVKAKLNVTYGLQVKTCDICCPDKSKGTETTTSVLIAGTAFLSATAGMDKTFGVDGYQVKVWAGLQFNGGTGITGSASWTSDTCSGPKTGTDLCVAVTPQITVRVGGEARLQLRWWSWTVGLQGYGQFTTRGKLCWHCDGGGCTFKGWQSTGGWHGNLGIRACLGTCYTLGEWNIF
jgi:RHS repeat-associated protein